MDTKAIREAVELEKQSDGHQRVQARKYIRSNAIEWLQQLLDENERLTADMEAAEISIKAWKDLEADFETLKGNYRQLLDEHEQLKEKSSTKILWGVIDRLRSERIVAVEALQKVVELIEQEAFRTASNKAIEAIERIESGENLRDLREGKRE